MFNLFTCLSANPCRRSSVNMKRETQLPTGLRAPLYLPTTVHVKFTQFPFVSLCKKAFRKQLSLEALGNLSPSYTVWCWFILVYVSPASSWAASVSSWRGLTSCHSSSACKEQDQKVQVRRAIPQKHFAEPIWYQKKQKKGVR